MTVWTDEQIRAATKALRDVAGACNGGTPESECVYMVTDGNCGCADMARAALHATPLGAAAPELLAVLKEAADTLERCRYSELPMAAKCRAVIAKAEGRP